MKVTQHEWKIAFLQEQRNTSCGLVNRPEWVHVELFITLDCLCVSCRFLELSAEEMSAFSPTRWKWKGLTCNDHQDYQGIIVSSKCLGCFLITF